MNKFKEEMFYSKYKIAKNKLETYINNLLLEYKNNNKFSLVDHTESRLKTISSAKDKLITKKYIDSFDNMSYEDILKCIDDNLNDIVGLRIVCPYLSDVYDVVKMIKDVNGEVILIEDEFDYIANPKPSGYSGYHLDVGLPVNDDGNIFFVQTEIQVRTMAQNVWAKHQHIACYKNKSICDKDEIFNSFVDSARTIREYDIAMQILNDKVKKANNLNVSNIPDKVFIKK